MPVYPLVIVGSKKILPEMKITILIAEDDPLLRQLLTSILGAHEDMEVVGAVGNGREALEIAERLKPRLLLLDLNLPEVHGLKVIDRVIDMPEPPLVLVLSGQETEETHMESARHGAHGFLGKSLGIATLPDAIRAIDAGEVWFTRYIMGQIFREYVEMARRLREFERPANQLSGKEVDVLVRVARGLTNQQIGEELGMSVSTVKVHVRSIFQKLDLPNRTEAAVFAVREGLLEEAPPEQSLRH